MKRIKLFIAVITLTASAAGIFGCGQKSHCPTYAGTHHKYNTRGL